MTHTPTPEQEAIITAARETSDNLLLVARAGAAKTSTLVMIAQALPNVPTTSLAFNVAIKKEMQARLPEHCTAMTMNGLGHRAWASFLGRRLEVDSGKMYKLLKEEINSIKSEQDKKSAFGNVQGILRTAGLAKHSGYVPAGLHSMAQPMLTEEEFFAELEEEPSWLEQDLVNTILSKSFRAAMAGKIDFDDQVLMPVIMPAQFSGTPLTLVDESQDLSAINHRMLRKLIKRQRLIAVGDPCQAIYGFRGAKNDSMEELQAQFNMKEMRLTVSFRCPQAVIEAARWRAPDMQWPSWAKPGAVRTLQRWDLDQIPDGAAVICRNNAPIFGLAFKLLRAGRYPELIGNDIVKGLVKTLTGLGPHSMPAEQLHSAIDLWQAREERRSRVPKTLADRAESLHIIADQGDTLGDAILWAETLQNASGRIKLMTGHKSKGLEFPEVFFLDRHLLKDDGQDPNVKYVIQTRAQERLTYINSEDLI